MGERPLVAVFQHAADDGRDFAHARVQVAAIGVGLVPVEEGELPAADFLSNGWQDRWNSGWSIISGVADQGSQGIVVVAHDPGRPQCIEAVQQRQVGK